MALKLPSAGKQLQVDKAQATMLGIVIGVSVVCVFSLVASKQLFSQANYLRKVASQKEDAVEQLKSNKTAVTSLVESYDKFAGQNPNLLGGNAASRAADRDGDNARLILDALPSKYDFPAMATSLEKLLGGNTINSIKGTDDLVTQEDLEESKIVDMPFEFEVDTTYVGMRTLIGTFEKSIRPFHIQKLKMLGQNGRVVGTITAKTFYQPEKNLKIEKQVVK